MAPSTEEKVIRVEWAELDGYRPRPCGRNARLGPHGLSGHVPLCRLTTSSGLRGAGLGRVSEEDGRRVLGRPLPGLLAPPPDDPELWKKFDFALFDLAGQRAGLAVYRLIAGDRPGPGPGPGALQVPCYDTALYFDDLAKDGGETDHAAAAAAVAAEAVADLGRGHRSFKVKVGRGGRWMGTIPGMDRDVAVVKAVREAVGPGSRLLVDANNGFTLNNAKEFLERTAEVGLGWLEEPFHEDRVLLAALREWMARAGIEVALADGESSTPDDALALAREGLIDVVQCDILDAGFGGWLRLGAALDRIGVQSAPHHYGLHLGNFVSGHLAGGIGGFGYVEWDEMTTPGLSTPGYRLRDGVVALSEEPGFGIDIDDQAYRRAVGTGGFEVS
jgi:L-alanine-DL-glutamate epimerase-like enolase superfamily enzyme